MIRFLIVFAIAIQAFAADDSWAKVRELKGGTELKIYKKDARQPVLAKMDEAADDSLIVVVKNEQVSIPKEQIDRIDYRPDRTGSRVTKETKTTVGSPDIKSSTAGRPQDNPGPVSSTSSSVSFGSKPDFETVYRRTKK